MNQNVGNGRPFKQTLTINIGKYWRIYFGLHQVVPLRSDPLQEAKHVDLVLRLHLFQHTVYYNVRACPPNTSTAQTNTTKQKKNIFGEIGLYSYTYVPQTVKPSKLIEATCLKVQMLLDFH